MKGEPYFIFYEITKMSDTEFLWSPSLLTRICGEIEDETEGEVMFSSSVEVTGLEGEIKSHNEIYKQFLSHVDKDKFDKFCTENSEDLKFITDLETKSLMKENFQDYANNRVNEKIDPVIEKLVPKLMECLNL